VAHRFFVSAFLFLVAEFSSCVWPSPGSSTRQHAFAVFQPVCGELLIFDTNQQFATHRLPAPNDTIYLVMRFYWPKTTPPSILPAGEGTWKPPAVKKVS
jgi:hypothetical protein